MTDIIKKFKNKGKLVLAPLLILGVLTAVAVFNRTQNQGTALVYAEDGLFLEASGTVESNAIEISSEVAGTLAESFVQEGSRIKEGEPVARISNTTITNQYNQAILNAKLAKTSLEGLKVNLANIEIQQQAAVEQAENSYLAGKAEYEKIKDGISPEEITQAQETLNQAKLNRDYLKQALDDAKDQLDDHRIDQSKYDEIEKNYNMAKAQYSAVSAQLKLLKSQPSDLNLEVARYRMLQAKSGWDLAVSNARTQTSQVSGEIEIARIRLEQYESAVRLTEAERSKLTIYSPLSGTVNDVAVKAGEFVPLGKPLVRISDPANLSIKAYVSEANISKVMVGQTVEILTDSDETKSYAGIVSVISDQAEFTPKNIQTKEERMNTVFAVKVRALEGPGIIKPGMPVDLRFKLNE